MQLTEVENLQKTIVTAPVAICLLDATTFIAELINNRLLEVTGMSAETITGRYYWDIFSNIQQGHEPILQEVLATGQTQSVFLL